MSGEPLWSHHYGNISLCSRGAPVRGGAQAGPPLCIPLLTKLRVFRTGGNTSDVGGLSPPCSQPKGRAGGVQEGPRQVGMAGWPGPCRPPPPRGSWELVHSTVIMLHGGPDVSFQRQAGVPGGCRHIPCVRQTNCVFVSLPHPPYPPGVLRTQAHQGDFICAECGKCFQQPSHLRAHMRAHTGTRLPLSPATRPRGHWGGGLSSWP